MADAFRRGSSGHVRARCGFVLPLVLGAMAVLALFFMVMSFLSSGQTQAASHFLDSSRSLSIARAGAEWAITAYASGSYEDNALCETLFGNSTKEGEFELQYPTELLRYIDEELKGQLVVKVKVCDITPLPIPDGLVGFNQDPVEKSGTMEFSAVGTVGKASRKVRIRKGFKVVMMVHPVLSKFTLFLREKPSQEVNVLKRLTANFGFEDGCSPIILNNQGFSAAGKDNSFGVVTPSTQEFDLSPVTKDGFAKLVRTSGWVFLNSKTSQPWVLNLSGGGDYSEYDDRLLLRAGLYKDLDLLDKLHKLPPPPTKEIISMIYYRYQGMKTDYEARSPQGDIQKKPSKILYMRYLFPDDPPKISFIRPFGTGTHFSPTLVFGPAYMQYMIFRGIDVVFPTSGTFPNVLIPGFLNEADFANAYKPKTPDDLDMADFARVLSMTDRNNPGQYFNWYSQCMTMIATSPYIEALDYIFLKNRESGSLLKPTAVQYDIPVPRMVGDTISSDIRPWVGNRDSLLTAHGAFGMDGEPPLFEGDLADIKGCKEFQSKVTAVFPSFKDLEAAFGEANSSRLRLPGIVYVGSGSMTIDKDLEITSPGIIISGGNICIKSAVKSSHPVTIVSLKDISVETGSPIDAHLICLMGTFRASGFNIRGGVAACSMAIPTMKYDKTIRFAPAHDPYADPDKWKQKAAYRYYLSAEEEYFVEGGKK